MVIKSVATRPDGEVIGVWREEAAGKSALVSGMD